MENKLRETLIKKGLELLDNKDYYVVSSRDIPIDALVPPELPVHIYSGTDREMALKCYKEAVSRCIEEKSIPERDIVLEKDEDNLKETSLFGANGNIFWFRRFTFKIDPSDYAMETVIRGALNDILGKTESNKDNDN